MCALHWSWAFGNETTTDLATMGWGSGGASNQTLTTDTDKVYTYSGSPTRYGWILKGNYGYFVVPAGAVSGLTNGWIAAPFKSLVASGIYSATTLRVNDTGGVGIYATVTGAGALSLYVANTFKETTAAIDWLSWRYVSLKWDMSSNPWSGQLYIDGIAVTSAYTEARSASSATTTQVGPGPGRFNSPDVFCSQIIIYNSASDAGETPYYATRVEPIANGTNIGTWTPNSGSDDYAVVASPLDVTTFTEDSNASPSDRVEVVSSHISSSIGIVPNTIVGVTGHTFSDGQSVTSRTVLSPSGGTEVSGSGVLISSGTVSYAFATDDGTYLSSDSVDLIYEIVST